ncbi:hypothetical protein PPO43_15005 [Saprospira sp. CCB-QB6]|uniref:hypothetical protein n=1 Tax=Saprospira sp. CCB-QB6 TaxID=3023936 RepID=UPI00234A007A|nr:hypothetical protein [Saprospira sp. CCB-QB6]WCL81283.1 hypothetical protein PPO43_15005 [Saprospira sp. CCB-QB6]
MKYCLIIICLVFVINRHFAQSEVAVNTMINVDSLLDDIDYARRNLLSVKEKVALIDSLLSRKDDYRISKGWRVSCCPTPAEIRATSHPAPTLVTKSAVALYLIECIIQDKFDYEEISDICLVYKKRNQRNRIFPEHCSVLRLYSVQDIIKDLEVVDRNKLVNKRHFKKIYRLYRRGINKLKKKKKTLDEIRSRQNHPLAASRYAWLRADFE